MQEHLDSGATTLAWCWRLARTDGMVLGFTDHDRDLEIDGTVYEAASGFTAGEIKESVGLSVDNLDVEGALQSSRLSEMDLSAGLYDGAEVEIYRVNWAEPGQRVLMRKGNLGEIRRGKLAFSAEVRGLAHKLNQPIGRSYHFACDAELGDERCGVDVDIPIYRASGAVTSVEARARFLATGLEAYEPGWFGAGVVRWLTGANAGLRMEVRSHAARGVEASLELWQGMSRAIAAGDTFEITAGCDKLFATCRSKFANGLNFRGFPHIPGNDFVLTYPVSGEALNDGSSRSS
jgi:uncharacterized phage protein (TIGR02218 family)